MSSILWNFEFPTFYIIKISIDLPSSAMRKQCSPLWSLQHHGTILEAESHPPQTTESVGILILDTTAQNVRWAKIVKEELSPFESMNG
jgi:hypothetical protein